MSSFMRSMSAGSYAILNAHSRIPLRAISDGQGRHLGMEAGVHPLRSEIEVEVLTLRHRCNGLEAAAVNTMGGRFSSSSTVSGVNPKASGGVVAGEVEAAVVDPDGPHAVQEIGGQPRHHVGDARRAAHAEDGEEAGAPELAVQPQLAARGVEEAAEVDVVAARLEGGLHRARG